MRAQPLPLPPAVAQFLATAAADYLDPYLDEAHGLHGGDHRRCPPPTQLFTHSLRAAWAERRARDPALAAALPAEASPNINPNLNLTLNPNPNPNPIPNPNPNPNLNPNPNPNPSPSPNEAAECALAAYVRHAVSKANACRGFEPHAPGKGRVGCAPAQQVRAGEVEVPARAARPRAREVGCAGSV